MTSSALRACSHCAHLNSPDARFCNQCGHGLIAGQIPPQYTPRHLTEKILQMRSALEGERKQVTVLFVDVKGSVALSQQVEAEAWHRIMDRFFALLTQTIHDYEGTINQYTGDGVMALFGAPLAHEDHARRACRAALGICQQVKGLAQELAQSHGIDFAARLGLNSGEVIVGRIGDDLRMDYTAQGQTVGLAARMEQLARPNTVLISEFTRELVEGYFELGSRGETSLKGYKGKLASYELKAALSGATRFAEKRRRDRPPLVGREREFSLLEAYRDRVFRENSGLLVAVTSDTGMGKSRLSFEFSRACREADIPVFETRGASHHRAEPLLPLADFFRDFFGLEEDEDAEASREQIETRLRSVDPPRRLIDNLLAVLDLDEDAARSDPGERIRQLQELMLLLLRGGAIPRNAVCIVENLHWLDDAAAAPFLDQVFEMLPRYGVLVVITARSDYPLRWADRPWFRHLPLRALDEAQTRALLDHLLGKDAAFDDLKRDIIDAAGGSPMFVEEVVRRLLGQGVLERDGKGMKMRRQPGQIELPPSVEAIIAARIDGLGSDSKRLLQLAAVIGRRVPLVLLEQVADGDDLEPALAELRDQDFLVRDVGPESRAALIFTQSLFQLVAYRMLLGEQRRELHARVARALEAQSARDPGNVIQLARHYRDAGEIEQAARWYLRAADDASRRELTEALQRLGQARKLFDTPADSVSARAMHLQVIARWLHLAARCGRDEGALDEAVAQGEALIEQGVSPVAEAFFRMACGTRTLLAGDGEEALVQYREAVRVADDDGLEGIRVVTRVGLVYGLQAVGDLPEALQEADQGLSLSAAHLDLGAEFIGHSPLIALQVFKAWISAWMGRLNQARELAGEALAAAQQRRDHEQIIAAQAVLAFVAAEAGEDGLAPAQAALRLAREGRNAAAEVIALMALGRAQLRGRQWAEAIPSLEDALARVRELAIGVGERARVEVDLALAQLAGGNARAARDFAARAVRTAASGDARVVLCEAQLAQVRAGLYSRRPLGFLKRYDSTLDEAWEGIQHCQARLLEPEWHRLRARWLSLKDDTEGAAAALAEAQRLAAECGLAPITDSLQADTG